jgi:hypothetical protein
MNVQRLIGAVVLSVLLPVSNPTHAQAQTPETPAQVPAKAPPLPPAPAVGSKWWIVGGGGFAMARAGCAVCDRSGVFTNSKSLFFDVGGRVSPRVDVGGEVMFVSARLEDSTPIEDGVQIEDAAPIRTTFILAIAQFRPWVDRGLYLRAGMGLAFAGNGLYNPHGPALKPPYSTNAFGVTYGIGWIFRRDHRCTIQAAFSHHIAALGELSTVSGETIKNVVGNYWTSGVAIAIR